VTADTLSGRVSRMFISILLIVVLKWGDFIESEHVKNHQSCNHQQMCVIFYEQILYKLERALFAVI